MGCNYSEPLQIYGGFILKAPACHEKLQILDVVKKKRKGL